MDTQDLIDYYADLLILQYRGQPKAYATIELMAQIFIADQIYLTVQNAYDLNTAVGVQLDVLGKYAGVSRNGYDFSGPVTLGDSDYRNLIKLKFILNNSSSSLYDIQSLLQLYFKDQIYIFDKKNMQINYFVDSSIGSLSFVQFFIKSGLLPQPMAVLISTVIYSNDTKNFFGFRTYDMNTPNNTPFNSYQDYKMDQPWLSYQNAIQLPSGG